MPLQRRGGLVGFVAERPSPPAPRRPPISRKSKESQRPFPAQPARASASLFAARAGAAARLRPLHPTPQKNTPAYSSARWPHSAPRGCFHTTECPDPAPRCRRDPFPAEGCDPAPCTYIHPTRLRHSRTTQCPHCRSPPLAPNTQGSPNDQIEHKIPCLSYPPTPPSRYHTLRFQGRVRCIPLSPAGVVQSSWHTVCRPRQRPPPAPALAVVAGGSMVGQHRG